MSRRRITRIYITPELRDRYLARFPGTGSLSWLVETAMTEMLDLTSGAPEATSVVRAAIRAAVLRERRHRKELDRTKPAATGFTDVTVEPTG